MPRDYTATVPVAVQFKDDIIARLASGETATNIAKSYGLKSHSAISHALADDPDYIQARIQFHTARLDNVEEEIRNSSDMFTLARVRETATMYRWRAERECRDLYGKDQPTQAQDTLNAVSAALLLRVASLLPKPHTAQPRVIEHEPSAINSIDNDADGETGNSHVCE